MYKVKCKVTSGLATEERGYGGGGNSPPIWRKMVLKFLKVEEKMDGISSSSEMGRNSNSRGSGQFIY